MDELYTLAILGSHFQQYQPFIEVNLAYDSSLTDIGEKYGVFHEEIQPILNYQTYLDRVTQRRVVRPFDELSEAVDALTVERDVSVLAGSDQKRLVTIEETLRTVATIHLGHHHTAGPAKCTIVSVLPRRRSYIW